MEFIHKPVLFDQCMEGLDIKPDGVYADGTLGGGGHASGTCSRLSDKGVFIGIASDSDAVAKASAKLHEL